MRVKKFSKFLELLPESEELREVREKTAAKIAENTAKVAAFRKKVKKWGGMGLQIYLALFWIVQTILDMGIFPF